MHGTSTHHSECLCHVSWKSFDGLVRCGPDKVRWDRQTDRQANGRTDILMKCICGVISFVSNLVVAT